MNTKLYIKNGADNYSILPVVPSNFVNLNVSSEKHGFIDFKNIVTSLSILNANKASLPILSHYLLAISYEFDKSLKASEHKGGISIFSITRSQSWSIHHIFDTKFKSKPIKIFWNKLKNEDINNVDQFSCKTITCLFDSGDVQVLEFVFDHPELIELFKFVPNSAITAFTASNLLYNFDSIQILLCAATELNNLFIIKLNFNKTNSSNITPSEDYTDDYATYTSKLKYKTLAFSLEHTPNSYIQTISFHPSDSGIFAMGSSVGILSIWDIRFGKTGELASYSISNKPIYHLAWTTSSKYIVGYSNSLFVIDWLKTHSVSHFDVTPHHYHPLCRGICFTRSDHCLLLLRNELIIFPFERLISPGYFTFKFFEWAFATPEDIKSHNNTINNEELNGDSLTAKDVLDHLDHEVSIGRSRVLESGIVLIRGVKEYRSAKSFKRRKCGESAFLTLNTSPLDLLNHIDFVLSPICMDYSPFDDIVISSGASGVIHIIIDAPLFDKSDVY